MEENANWFSIPLFLYDHSDTVYRVGEPNPFSCPWIPGRVGIIALDRDCWPREYDDARLAAYAQQIAECYTDWANGRCYGYILLDSNGHEVDTCWGYIGEEAVREAVAEAVGAVTPQAGGFAPSRFFPSSDLSIVPAVAPPPQAHRFFSAFAARTFRKRRESGDPAPRRLIPPSVHSNQGGKL